MVEHHSIIIRGKSHAKEFSNALETDSAMMSLIFLGNLFSSAVETDTGYRNKNHAKPAAEIVKTARLIS